MMSALRRYAAEAHCRGTNGGGGQTFRKRHRRSDEVEQQLAAAHEQNQALQLAAVEVAGRDERIAKLEADVRDLKADCTFHSSLFTLHLTAYLTKHENYETVSRC